MDVKLRHWIIDLPTFRDSAVVFSSKVGIFTKYWSC